MPIVFVGAWSVWSADSIRGRIALSAGLAGAWLASGDIAGWLTVGVAIVIASKLFAREEPAVKRRMILVSAITFVLLGVFPFVSKFYLEGYDTSHVSVAPYLANLSIGFPGLFRTIRVNTSTDDLFQLGFSPLFLSALAIPLLVYSKPKGLWLFLVPPVLITILLVPLGGVTSAIWTLFPRSFLAIEDLWPAPGSCRNMEFFATRSICSRHLFFRQFLE